MRLESLPIALRDGELVPRYLGAHDHPWLRALLELVGAHEGARWGELEARLREPVADAVPRPRQALAAAVLRPLLRRRIAARVAPRALRAELFVRAAVGGTRAEVLAEVGAMHGLSPREVEAALFGDLARERVIDLREALPSPLELALCANLQLCRTILMRAVAVDLTLLGNARAVVRIARLRGLLCTVEAAAAASRLQLSGPLSLLRQTTMYGRALGSLVPALTWCDDFRLVATCAIGDDLARFHIRRGDPIQPGREGRRFDSKVEARLARDLLRAAPEWTVVREPEPIAVGRTLLFPDFALAHRRDPSRSWLLEIVGFWTPGYLDQKLRGYAAAGIARLILCIDARLACAADAMPRGAHIVRYQRRVDVAQILAIVS